MFIRFCFFTVFLHSTIPLFKQSTFSFFQCMRHSGKIQGMYVHMWIERPDQSNINRIELQTVFDGVYLLLLDYRCWYCWSVVTCVEWSVNVRTLLKIDCVGSFYLSQISYSPHIRAYFESVVVPNDLRHVFWHVKVILDATMLGSIVVGNVARLLRGKAFAFRNAYSALGLDFFPLGLL